MARDHDENINDPPYRGLCYLRWYERIPIRIWPTPPNIPCLLFRKMNPFQERRNGVRSDCLPKNGNQGPDNFRNGIRWQCVRRHNTRHHRHSTGMPGLQYSRIGSFPPWLCKSGCVNEDLQFFIRHIHHFPIAKTGASRASTEVSSGIEVGFLQTAIRCVEPIVLNDFSSSHECLPLVQHGAIKQIECHAIHVPYRHSQKGGFPLVANAMSFRLELEKNSWSATKEQTGIAFNGLFVVLIPYYQRFSIASFQRKQMCSIRLSRASIDSNPCLMVSGRKGGIPCCGLLRFSWC